jgi:FixJ family two-component response regulator
MTSAGAPTVFIIDDDAAVRASIQDLLESFDCVEAFLLLMG